MARLAILIGCSTYDDERFRRLTKPTQDVNGLGEVLESPRVGGFDSVVRMIDPAWHEVRPALTSFFRSSGPDDLLFIFFAGHGVKDSRGELFFAFKNTQLDDLDGTAISDRFVARQMDKSRTEAQVLVLDCCFSGAFGRDMRATLGSSAGVLDAYADISNASVGVGRVVLTASDSIQYSWEGEEVKGDSSNSIFTRSLISGLKSGEADRDRDGIIAIDELYEYLLISVAGTNRSQVPQLLTRPGPRHGAICIARNLFANPSVVGLPNSLSNRLVSKERLVRFAALADAAKLAKKSEHFKPALRRRFADIAIKDPDRGIRYYAWQLLRSEEAKLIGPTLVRGGRAAEVMDVMPGPFEWCSIPSGYVTLEGVRDLFPVGRFQISKYPITVAQFDVFISAEDGYTEDEWWLGLAVRHHTPVKQPLTDSRLPRVRVSWYEAVAFCRWLAAITGSDIRLPTEWEWQWAASSQDGGSYPWGTVFYRRACNSVEAAIERITPVDAYEDYASQFGVVDAAGNVWERCLNEFKHPFKVELTGRRNRVVRGGSWQYPAEKASITHRHVCLPEKRFPDGGFRIVRLDM